MDNLTHSLIGLSASKAGLERLSPGTTTLCILAANAPDADIVALAGGRWAYLHHHRGITHSIAGTIVLAVALPLAFFLVDLLIARIRKRPSESKIRRASDRFFPGQRYAPADGLDEQLRHAVLVAVGHSLVLWRSVFIIDPFIWVVLGGSAFLLTSRTKLQGLVWLVIAGATTFLVLFGARGPAALPNPTPLRIFWIVALILIVVLFKFELAQPLGRQDIDRPLLAIVLPLHWRACLGFIPVALNRTQTEAV